MTPGGTSGVPTAPRKQGVEAPPLLEDLVGQHHAVAQVAGAAEVVVDGLELDAGRADDLQALGHDLGADAVAADHADAVGHVVRSFLRLGRGGPNPARERRNRPPRWTVEERTPGPARARE